MSDTYTPTVDDMWDVMLYGAQQASQSVGKELDAAEFRGQFDRAVAAVRAAALREAADALTADQVETYGIALPDVHEVIDWLHTRAEQEAAKHA